jgi:predicted GTPase
MNNSKLSIGIFGTFQNGKSTLVNCLANSDIALVGGEGVSVTHTNVRYTYGDSKDVIIITNDDNRISVPLSQYFNNPNGFSAREIVVESKCPTLEYFDIIDTPGFNANDSDTFLAERIIKEIDFAILLVRNKGISQNEKKHDDKGNAKS